ncbi:MAG: DUF3800 domain-containing protein [Bosea sp. (in: a-proteobacteria)]|jgi:hypothetical protein
MHLLYLDDAGSVGNPQERFFILAGVALFERQTYHLERQMDEVASRFGSPQPKALELHGNQMLAGRNFWRNVPKADRRRAIADGLSAIRNLRGEVALFGAVVEKRAVSPEDPVEFAFEEVASRFDKKLLRLHRNGRSERGIIVLDKSTMETRLQALATEFRFQGHRAGRLHNLADVPFFVDSKASRLVQYADLVAYALWRHFEKQDSEFFDIIKNDFDREGGVVHGLLVKTTGQP